MHTDCSRNQEGRDEVAIGRVASSKGGGVTFCMHVSGSSNITRKHVNAAAAAAAAVLAAAAAAGDGDAAVRQGVRTFCMRQRQPQMQKHAKASRKGRDGDLLHEGFEGGQGLALHLNGLLFHGAAGVRQSRLQRSQLKG